MDEQTQADVAACFQQAVVDTLSIKCRRALKQEGLNTLVIAGGVSANTSLREALDKDVGEATFKGKQGQVFYPAPQYCTDNGAMIAYAGSQRLLHGQCDDLSVSVRPRWPINELPPLS